MKAMTNLVKGTMLIVLSILVFSCSDGEDGAIGPVGPAGQDGVDGVDGVDGQNGTDGQDGADGADGAPGTANVIYSEWIAENFIIDGPQQSNLMGLEVLNSSEYNPDADVVLVYGRRNNDSPTDGIYQLPYLFSSQSEYYTFALPEVTGGIGLRVVVNTTDGGTNNFDFFDEYRFVIIPGGVAKSSRDVTTMSYEEIIALFNISE